MSDVIAIEECIKELSNLFKPENVELCNDSNSSDRKKVKEEKIVGVFYLNRGLLVVSIDLIDWSD